jgi:hypothetical protein
MLATARQETPAGEDTTSTAKTPATAGSVCGKAIEVARNEARIMAVNVAEITKMLWP